VTTNVPTSNPSVAPKSTISVPVSTTVSQADNVSCLAVAHSQLDVGCNGVRDRSQCLSSRDGRTAAEWMGLKIANQPCVWCGGKSCTNLGDAVCEPADFMLRGQASGVWRYGVPLTLLEHAVCPLKWSTSSQPFTTTTPHPDWGCLTPCVSHRPSCWVQCHHEP